MPMLITVDNSLSSATHTVTLGLNDDGITNLDCTVDWGDGTVESFTTSGNKEHTYPDDALTYTISITGTVPHFGYADTGYHYDDLFAGVTDWGDLGTTSLEKACFEWRKMSELPNWIPASVTNLNYMFSWCWMGQQFEMDAALSGWDVSNVTSMQGMFEKCDRFNGQVGGWNVSNVTDFSFMFWQCDDFNQALDSWVVDSATTMEEMFYSCDIFTSDLSGWNVSNVTGPGLAGLFYYCQALDFDFSGWNVSNITDLSNTFAYTDFTNFNLASWDVSKVTSFYSTFFYCQSFSSKTCDFSGWDVSSATTMNRMFNGCDLVNPDFSNWDVSKVTDFFYTFLGCSRLKPNIGVQFWDVSSATTMKQMFAGCGDYEFAAADWNEDLSGWDVSNVTDFAYMFNGSPAFNSDLSMWDVVNATSAGMEGMFRDCISFNQDLSFWCVPNIASEPNDFSLGTTAWVLPKPVWGTCPVPGNFHASNYSDTTIDLAWDAVDVADLAGYEITYKAKA